MNSDNLLPTIRNYHFDDFTEKNYKKILKIAKKKYSFVSYRDYRKKGEIILWRHDVDFSMHRSYRIAQIENEENVKSIYFLHLHSIFYNLFEEEISQLVFHIIDLGHDVGLHFDPCFYRNIGKNDSEIIKNICREKRILRELFETEIHAISFHNPDSLIPVTFPQTKICGMVNVYSPYILKRFNYCSDSNGYWRYKRLTDFLNDAEGEPLHVLTHPGWWTPEVVSPRERITRCIEGRAKFQHAFYDNLLEELDRENIP